MKYYTAKESLKILLWPHNRVGWLRLQQLAKRKQVRTMRKNSTKRARLYYCADDISALASKLDRLPRDGVLAGEAANLIGISRAHVLRKKAVLRAVRHPISRFWLFPMSEIKNYLSK